MQERKDSREKIHSRQSSGIILKYIKTKRKFNSADDY